MDYVVDVLKKSANHSTVMQRHACALIDNKYNIKAIAINGVLKNIKLISSTGEIKSFKKTLHAEMNVFNNYPLKKCKGLDLIVIRLSKNGNLLNSKPCINCISNLKCKKLRNVIYSNDLGGLTIEYSNDLKNEHISIANRKFKM